jgi:cytoskeletal protein RodZ
MLSFKRIGFSALVAVVVALVALNILVWQGFLITKGESGRGAKSPATTTTAKRATPPPAPTTSTATTTQTVPTAQPPPPPPPAIGISTIVLTATRGDCWVVARSDSAQGPVLYQALLRKNTSTRLKAKRLWLSLGAAGNLDILVDGKPAAVPAGTVAFLVPKTSSA